MNFIPTGYFPVHFSEKRRGLIYKGERARKEITHLRTNSYVMQKIIGSDSIKTTIRLVVVLLISFILVNLFA